MIKIPAIPGRDPHNVITLRIPDPALPLWIAYCRRNCVTQSAAIRRAVAAAIDRDEQATNNDLVLAALLRDGIRSYAPRA